MDCGYFSAAMSSLAPSSSPPPPSFGAIGFQSVPACCPCDPSVFSLNSLHSSFVVCARYTSSSSSADHRDSFDCRAGGFQMRSSGRLDSPGTVVAVLRNVKRRSAEAFRCRAELASDASPPSNLAKTRSPVDRQIISSHPLASFVDKAGTREFILQCYSTGA